MADEWSQLAECDVSWCVRRLPHAVKKACMELPITLAGGFIRSCIAREPVADIDLFVTSKDAAKMLAALLTIQGDPPPHETENAYTVRSKLDFPVQVIHRWTFDKPEYVVPSFDFTIARAAIWFDQSDKKWHSAADPDFYRDLAAKRLVYCSPIRNEDAGGSMLRVLKFYQRGYRIPLDSLAAVTARMVNAIDFGQSPDDPHVSREQWIAKILTGLLHEVDPNIGVPVAYED